MHLLNGFIRNASTHVTTIGLMLFSVSSSEFLSASIPTLLVRRPGTHCRSLTLSEMNMPASGQASGKRDHYRNAFRARVSFGDSVTMPVHVTVNGASVCPFQCSAWTAALWSAPPFSRPCAPWIATKLKSDSQRTVAARCQQGRSVLSIMSFLLPCVLASWEAQFQACSVFFQQLGKPDLLPFLQRNH